MATLSLAIWLPIAFGILILAVGRDEHANTVRWAALIGALAGLMATIPLITGFDASTAAMQFTENLPWIERFQVRYHLGVDGISMWFAPLTAFITVIVVIAAWEVVTDRVNQAARAAGIARHLPIHVLIETHGALAQVFDIASLVQVECLSFGLMDFVSAHNGAIPGAAMGSPEQFEHPLICRALTDISAACHAHGKVPSHNVSTDIKHPDRAGRDAARARNEFGYLRKWSIHPDQIAPIVSAFRPSHEEVTQAAAILAAAQDASWGPIQHDGRLHDRASYRYWWAVLQRAHTTGVDMPPAAAKRFFE